MVVVASFAVRLAAWSFWGTGAIESEGANYARLAENLRNGVGYFGLNTPGKDLIFAPLYPLLISFASLLTSSYEQAGRLVSLFLGALLPIPVFGIACLLFNRWTAFIAAALVVLNPLLVNLSFSVLSEGPYITVLLSAVWVALLAFSRPSISMWCLAGGAFGFAYLIRQEALAALLVALVFGLFATPGSLLSRSRRVFTAMVVFLMIIAPEVIFFYRSTGKLRLEGKSTVFFALSQSILAEQANLHTDAPSLEARTKAAFLAEYAIDPNLRGIGTAIRPNAEVIQETHITLSALARIVATATRQNMPVFFQQVSSRWFGSPLLPALALLGAVRQAWPRSSLTGRLFVIFVPMTAVLSTLFALWTDTRFYFVLVPFLLIWAADGLVALSSWAAASLAEMGWPLLMRRTLGIVFSALVGLAAVIYPIKGVRSVWEFVQGSPLTQIVKDVGLWVGQQQAHQVRIMDLSTPLAFHAGATYLHYPYCSGDQAIRFLDAASVDYVILRQGELTYGDDTPYYEDWLKGGIPDPRAQLVFTSSGVHAGELRVFQWNHSPDPTN
jgi:4-amino-4-deoxy-L-arabinose transferase-like glycosyltransferase